MWKSFFSKKSGPDELLLRQQLNAVHRDNHQLAKALAQLVRVNEEWDQSFARIAGKSTGWYESYLAKAREALAAHAEYARLYRSKKG